MPPKKSKISVVIPNFPPAKSDFTFNQGFRPGLSDNPPLLGQKPVPEGKPYCLEGLTFVATGTMPSLTRDDLKDLIERHGGRLTGSISGKTNVLIRGCIEVGPKKLSDAKSKNLVIIDEDGLFSYLQETNPNWVPPPPPVIEGGPELSKIDFPISSLLSEKYRPRHLSDIIGNLGAINQLIDFFENYDSNNNPKCAIISGKPGIGKSTCSSLVSLYCGYQPFELNASDTRSKKVLNDEFSDIFDNKSLESFTKPFSLIFDEVDGISMGDRGGLQELVKLIDRSKNPVICICNDRNDKRLDTLAKRSIDIKFVSPPNQEIFLKLEKISKIENIIINKDQLLNISQNCGGDIRHAINTLQFWALSNNFSNEEIESGSKVIPIVDSVDATMRLLKPSTSLEERIECFFVDYSLVPLYIHENLQFNGNIKNWANSLDSISIGDNIDNIIFQENDWSLLPTKGLFSTIIPSINSPGKDWGAMAKFPQIWGKLSRQKKIDRYIREISSRIYRNCTIPTN